MIKIFNHKVFKKYVVTELTKNKVLQRFQCYSRNRQSLTGNNLTVQGMEGDFEILETQTIVCFFVHSTAFSDVIHVWFLKKYFEMSLHELKTISNANSKLRKTK